jgi:hypothetical protein
MEPPDDDAAVVADSAVDAVILAQDDAQFLIVPLRNDSVVDVKLVDRCECLGLPAPFKNMTGASGGEL